MIEQAQASMERTASTSQRPSRSKGQRALFLTLGLVAPLSSSSSRAETEWLLLFPQSSTLSVGVPHVRATRSSPAAPYVLPRTADQLTLLQSFFAVSKTQLAQICGVQRQTIYDWFAGKFEAEGKNAHRVARLFRIGTEAKASGAAPFAGRDLTRLLADGSTVLNLLASEAVDSHAINAVLTQLRESGQATPLNTAAAQRQRLGWQPISEEAAVQNLNANLDDFVDG